MDHGPVSRPPAPDSTFATWELGDVEVAHMIMYTQCTRGVRGVRDALYLRSAVCVAQLHARSLQYGQY